MIRFLDVAVDPKPLSLDLGTTIIIAIFAVLLVITAIVGIILFNKKNKRQ